MVERPSPPHRRMDLVLGMFIILVVLGLGILAIWGLATRGQATPTPQPRIRLQAVTLLTPIYSATAAIMQNPILALPTQTLTNTPSFTPSISPTAPLFPTLPPRRLPTDVPRSSTPLGIRSGAVLSDCNLSSEPFNVTLIYPNGDFVDSSDATVITAVLALDGTPIAWNSQVGFDLDEEVQRLNWFVVTLANRSSRYIMIARGATSKSYYAFATDSRDEYIAPYGGLESWHVRCGGWRITNTQHISALYEIFEQQRRPS